jgi:cold shock CspA family protein
MSLEEGQTVEFNIKTNEKGEIAQNVTVRSEP